MKIIVTGGAGFIGAYTAKKLMERGDEVVIIDNFNDYYDPKLKKSRVKNLLKKFSAKIYTTDIRNYKDLERIFKKEKADKILHLAAMAGVRYSLLNPLIYEEVNVGGTLNLLELSKKYKIEKFVYASSSSVYGGNKKIPFSETDSVDNPISPYAASKKASELFANVYSKTFDLKTIGLRFFTVYGPWGRPDMAYFKFTQKIFNGETIEVYNKGKMQRDFTYIDDIVSGTILVLDKETDSKIFNIGGDKPEQLMDFIALIEKYVGKKAKIKFLPMQPGEVKKTISDVSSLKSLGGKPGIGIGEGLKNFVDWYRDYFDKK
ncbi:MAG: SDR family NAD(P)-dependent oxidoreductase [Candidatus Moranbacteria bacterium]|nr:SDR family NAD(P)-dependent oxidoreductase [Candidatus Moranbacteria bacterium]